jgi:hypothetical protein
MLELLNFKLITALSFFTMSAIALAMVFFVGLALSSLAQAVRDNRTDIETGLLWSDVFIFGYAATVLVLWSALLLGLSIKSVSIYLFIFSSVVCLLRCNLFEFPKYLETLILMAFFQGLLLLLAAAALRPEVLPIALESNNDIFNYANQAIVALSPSPASADTFLGVSLYDALKKDVFGAVVWLILPSLITERPPIEVTLPAMLSSYALLGAVLFDFFRLNLSLSRGESGTLALFTLTNGVFLFLVFSFFLAHILYFGIFIALLNSTVNALNGRSYSAVPIVMRALPYYFLIWMTYPYLIITTLFLHIALLAILLWDRSDLALRGRLTYIARPVVLLIVAVAITLFFLVPTRFVSTLELLRDVSGGRTSDVLVSLPAVFFGGVTSRMPSGTNFINNIVIALVMMFSLTTLILLWRRRKSSRAVTNGAALLLVFLFSTLGFIAVSIFFGQTYQQWKYATYYPLVLNGMIPAATLMLLRAKKPKFAPVVLGAVCLLVVVNLWGASRRDFVPVQSNYRELKAVDSMTAVKTILVDTLPFGEVMLLRQYITDKFIRASSPSYYPHSSIVRSEVGPESPILSRDPCFGYVSEAIQWSNGFFLSPSLPSLDAGAVWRFDASDCRWVVTTEGISGPEPGGRWTQSENVRLVVELSGVLGASAKVRIRASPLIIKGILDEQLVRAVINEGAVTAEFRYTEIGLVDWFIDIPSGSIQGTKLIIDFTIPTARVVSEVDPLSLDKRRLGLFLAELSIVK